MSGAKVIQYNWAFERDLTNQQKVIDDGRSHNPLVGYRWVYFDIDGNIATSDKVVQIDVESGVVVTKTEVLVRG